MKFAQQSQPFKRPDMTILERHQQLCRELRLVDEVGFDFAFAAEQHFTQCLPSPALFCSYGAQHTKRIRLGPMGYVAPFHNPIVIAEEAAVLDTILNGRLELGIVPGIIPPHFEVLNADWANRGKRTEEAIQLVKAIAGGTGPIDFTGPFHQYKGAKLTVPTVQKPHPPLWRMSRTPKELAFLAAEGVNTGYLLFAPRATVAPYYRDYLKQWKAAGHKHKPRVAFATMGYVDETDELARAKAAQHIVHSLVMIYGSGFGGSTDGLVQSYLDRGEPGAAEAARNLENAEYYFRNRLVFVGSPETVTQQIKEAAIEGCFNTLLMEFNIGMMPEEDIERSIRLFGERVIPALRDFEPADFN